MPLRLPRPPTELVEAFEAERAHSTAVDDAIVASLVANGEPDAEKARGPEKMWLLGAMPVEGLPRGSVMDLNFMDALRIRCWRFFVGMDDGSHVELDFRGGAIVSATHVGVGQDSWLGFISRACLLWARQTGGNNEASLLEFPWVNIRAVRAQGPDAGVVMDEMWPGGNHGMPMDEPDFVGYIMARFEERRTSMQAEVKGQ